MNIDSELNLIISGKSYPFSLYQHTYSEIHRVCEKNPALVQTTYESWSRKISPELKKSILESVIIKFNNIFGYAIRKGIVEKADGVVIKMRLLHIKISSRYSLLKSMNELPYDMTKLIVQTMFEIGF